MEVGVSFNVPVLLLLVTSSLRMKKKIKCKLLPFFYVC